MSAAINQLQIVLAQTKREESPVAFSKAGELPLAEPQKTVTFFAANLLTQPPKIEHLESLLRSLAMAISVTPVSLSSKCSNQVILSNKAKAASLTLVPLKKSVLSDLISTKCATPASPIAVSLKYNSSSSGSETNALNPSFVTDVAVKSNLFKLRIADSAINPTSEIWLGSVMLRSFVSLILSSPASVMFVLFKTRLASDGNEHRALRPLSVICVPINQTVFSSGKSLRSPARRRQI